ncbi:MAG: hypothetical protein R3293_06185 [Candidatus Promineifilaceae bacterium]|nr:hypothetical protein [Candidatus Promineifilaceae bacterium]
MHKKVKMLPLLNLDCDCDEAAVKVIDALVNANLRVVTSFDSQHTCEPGNRAPCPHHGTAVCDCRIIILLIYEATSHPATLLAHGQDGETWVSLATAAGQRPTTGLENKIRLALSALPATLNDSSL